MVLLDLYGSHLRTLDSRTDLEITCHWSLTVTLHHGPSFCYSSPSCLISSILGLVVVAATQAIIAVVSGPLPSELPYLSLFLTAGFEGEGLRGVFSALISMRGLHTCAQHRALTCVS